MSEIQKKTFRFWTLFLPEIRTLKNPNGTKDLDFRHKKVSEIQMLCSDFRHFFYLHISALNLFSEANCGSVKTKPKKACCKPFRSQWYMFKGLDFRHCLKSKPAQTSKIQTFGTRLDRFIFKK